jgi:hypothetical protein
MKIRADQETIMRWQWRLGIVAGVVLLSGCGHAPGVYDLPPAEVFARLTKADMNGFRMARQCGILIHFERKDTPGQAVSWTVTSSDTDMVRFTVRLTPVSGGGTSTTIEVPAGPNGGEAYDGNQSYPRPALQQPLRPEVQELIDAAIDQRRYDIARLPQPTNLDRTCNVQRAGLESGKSHFAVGDHTGYDTESGQVAFSREAAEEAARTAAQDAAADPAQFTKPTVNP